MASPSTIHATVPEQGRKLTFARALQVETETDLKINLSTVEIRGVSSRLKILLLTGILAVLAGLRWSMNGLYKRAA